MGSIHTGVRVTELSGLNVDDIDLTNGYLGVMGQGKKERYVPIGSKVTEALLKYKISYRPEANGSVSVKPEPLIESRLTSSSYKESRVPES